jgi:hypothetical protein
VCRTLDFNESGFICRFTLTHHVHHSQDSKCNMIVMSHDKSSEEEWIVAGGKIRYHNKSICDVMFIPRAPMTKPATLQARQLQNKIQTTSRLISLSQDRVSLLLHTRVVCANVSTHESSLISYENNIKTFPSSFSLSLSLSVSFLFVYLL